MQLINKYYEGLRKIPFSLRVLKWGTDPLINGLSSGPLFANSSLLQIVKSLKELAGDQNSSPVPKRPRIEDVARILLEFLKYTIFFLISYTYVYVFVFIALQTYTAGKTSKAKRSLT